MKSKTYKSTNSLIAALALLLSGFPVLWAEDHQDVEERVLSAAAVTHLDGSSIDGDIIVQSHAKDEVLLQIHREIQNESGEIAAKAFAVLSTRFEIKGDTIILKPELPRKSGEWKEATGKKNIKYSIRYDLWVPDRLNLVLKTVDGDITVTGMSGKSNISTVDGDIQITTAGEFLAQTVDGDIRADLNGQPRDKCVLRAVDGDIALSLDPALAVELRLQSLDGDRTVELPLDGMVKTAGQLMGTRNGGGTKIVLNIVDGDILVK